MIQIMLCTAVFFGALGCISHRVRVGSAFFTGMKRCVCAVWVLYLLSLVPGMRTGVNALSIATVAVLGAPGAVLLQVVSLMP